MHSPVGLLGLATAKPPHDLPQEAVARVARDLFEPRFAGYARMAQGFRTAGAGPPQSVMPIEWYLEPRGWPERTAAYLEAGVDLFVQAAEGALAEAELAGS